MSETFVDYKRGIYGLSGKVSLQIPRICMISCVLQWLLLSKSRKITFMPMRISARDVGFGFKPVRIFTGLDSVNTLLAIFEELGINKYKVKTLFPCFLQSITVWR